MAMEKTVSGNSNVGGKRNTFRARDSWALQRPETICYARQESEHGIALPVSSRQPNDFPRAGSAVYVLPTSHSLFSQTCFSPAIQCWTKSTEGRKKTQPTNPTLTKKLWPQSLKTELARIVFVICTWRYTKACNYAPLSVSLEPTSQTQQPERRRRRRRRRRPHLRGSQSRFDMQDATKNRGTRGVASVDILRPQCTSLCNPTLFSPLHFSKLPSISRQANTPYSSCCFPLHIRTQKSFKFFFFSFSYFILSPLSNLSIRSKSFYFELEFFFFLWSFWWKFSSGTTSDSHPRAIGRAAAKKRIFVAAMADIRVPSCLRECKITSGY